MSSSELTYCPHAQAVFARLRCLYEQRDTSLVLAVMNPPNAALEAFAQTHAEGYCPEPDPQERIRFWDTVYRERAAICDDGVPAAYLSEMDQGLAGSLVGGQAQFLCDPTTGWISSMLPPVLSDLAQAERLTFREDHPWWQRYLRQLKIFARGAAGKFGVSHCMCLDSVNFIFELVGATQAYIELMDRPELARRVIEFAEELTLRIQSTFFQHVPLVAGGTCSNMLQWAPGRIVSESVDPFHMTSVGFFEEWGREPVEKLFARFDGGNIHIHANGRHLLEAARTLRGLKAIYLGDDKGYPRAFDVLADIRRRVGDVPLVATVAYPQFAEALSHGALVGGVCYNVVAVPSVDEANRCMDRVRVCRGVEV